MWGKINGYKINIICGWRPNLANLWSELSVFTVQASKSTSQDEGFLVYFITTFLLQQITDKYSQTDNQGLSNKSGWYFTVSLYLFLPPLSPTPSSLSRECLTPKLLFCFLQGPTAFFLKLLYDYLKRDLKIKKDCNNR